VSRDLVELESLADCRLVKNMERFAMETVEICVEEGIGLHAKRA
jgi:hypothetical protein